uniref:GDSL-like lipase/acylhydrolase n=1 Tax=Pseudomonas phage Cygsa01 TaxID=3138529 RepID=A0AAU6W3I1_9VIRU
MSTAYNGALGYVPSAEVQSVALATLPTNDRIAIFGDSRTFQCSTAAGGCENYGYLFWSLFFARQRCRYDLSDNYGIGGDTTAMMLARIAPVLASQASVVIVLGSTNDRGAAALTAQQSINNLTSIRDQLRAAGKVVIFVAEVPRGDTTFTANRLSGTQLAYHAQVRQWILNQAAQPGVYVADPWPYMCDPASATGDCKVGYLHDGLHPNTTGAFYLATPIASILNFLYPAPNVLPSSNFDQISVDNPLGCVNVNPMMTGTAGTPATGGSGQLADGYTGTQASGANGITRTYSKVTKNGQEWQQCVLAGTASGTAAAVDIARQISLHAKVIPGKYLEAVADIEWDAGLTNIQSIQLGIAITDPVNGTVTIWDGDRYTAASVIPNVAASGVLRVPRMLVPAGVTDVRLRLTAYAVDGSTVSGTIRCRAMALRHLAS